MIVRQLDEALLLVTQPDHAHLAGRLMMSSAPLLACPRRVSVLRAIADHDNGWEEVDSVPRVDPTTGGVVDFVSAPVEVRQGVWPRGVARLADDPWAAALVAQHAITVYDRYRTDPVWTAFFDTMAAMRDEYVATSGEPAEALAGDYVFVRLADLISLAFCTGWTGDHGFGGWMVRGDGRHVFVTPDAFAGAVVPIVVEARRLERRPYRNDEDLATAIERADVVTLEGAVSAA